MIAKSTKTKRRHQAAEARLILAAFERRVVHVHGRTIPDVAYYGSLNERNGALSLQGEAAYIAAYPRGSRERHEAAASANSAVCTVLGHWTPVYVLRNAGLL